MEKGCRLEAEVYDNGKLVASGAAIRGEAIDITIPGEVKLWSPDTPFLYTLKVRLKQNSTETDAVDSYAAMRKFSSKRDASGVMRMQLNNRDLFQFGPLDQGWWPDGLYTAPTDEALIYDIQKTKDFGFNMIRKHVKVEPARWYAHCDRIGIIVWQDMPNGDKMHEWNQRDYFTGADLTRTPQSEAIYFKEWKEIMDYLYSYPCIGVWVPFNEGWGQFKTEETANLTKQYDGTRLVNAASGGNHYTCGDMLDIHSYPGPEPFLYDARRANVIGEYGGIGYVVKGHVWEADRNWGYIRFNTSKEVTDEYVKYAQELKKLALKGFTGAVYTQTSDVEIEVNGLMTYDRKVIKVDESVSGKSTWKFAILSNKFYFRHHYEKTVSHIVLSYRNIRLSGHCCRNIIGKEAQCGKRSFIQYRHLLPARQLRLHLDRYGKRPEPLRRLQQSDIPQQQP